MLPPFSNLVTLLEQQTITDTKTRTTKPVWVELEDYPVHLQPAGKRTRELAGLRDSQATFECKFPPMSPALSTEKHQLKDGDGTRYKITVVEAWPTYTMLGLEEIDTEDPDLED